MTCDLDGDPVGIELRATTQRVPDPLLHIRRSRNRGHGDEIGDTLDPGDVPHRALRFLLLVIPVHLAPERDPSVFDYNLNPLVRHEDVPLERVYRRSSDLRIGALRAGWQ